MGNSDSIRSCINPAGGLDVNTSDLTLLVNMGRLPGYSTLDKFGFNPSVEPSTDPEDIIEQGGRIQYDTNGTAPIMYVSSSSALDTGQTVSVDGLDIDGNFLSQEIITNGQTNVLLDTPLWRQFRMENNDDTLDIQGILYCHTDASPTAGVPADANIRTIINGNKNQTLFTGYTVQKGKVGFLYRGELGVELEGNAATLSEYAHCHYESRRYGKLFKVKKSVTVFPGQPYIDERPFKDILPALTDIRLVAESVTQEMGLFGTFDVLLVDEDQFSDEYLAAIGQPGY